MTVRLIVGWLAALAAASAAATASAACNLRQVGELAVTVNGRALTVAAKVNGVDARFIPDTGSPFSTVTPAAAAKFGLKVGQAPFGFGTMQGLTGDAQARFATAKDVTIIGYPFHNVDFFVGIPQLAPTADGLLGENLLTEQTDVEYDLADGVIRFFRPEGCFGADLAYWAVGRADSVVEIDPITPRSGRVVAIGNVNGARLRMQFDSGAFASVMSMKAAKRAGLTPETSQVAGHMRGVGAGLADTWVAPIKSFDLGGEHVANAHLQFATVDLADVDMLLGADFFLSHRIYVARSQNRLYFTYNGGTVFSVGRPPAAPAPVAPTR